MEVQLQSQNSDMTRFFMSIPQAVELVLKSTEMMEGREIFILKSMSSVKIIDIAEILVEDRFQTHWPRDRNCFYRERGK